MNRLDASTGALAVGLAADLAVVDADLLAIDTTDIASVGVVQTYVDGVRVHGS